MNLGKLFEMQKVLDERILKEKGLEGQDLLSKKVRALLTELGELSNEERSFKFWSEDRAPRTEVFVLKKEYQHLHITQTGAYEFQLRDEFGKVIFDDVTDHHHDRRNFLLEEYVDCLHFILSVGLEHEFDYHLPAVSIEPLICREYDIDAQIIALMQADWDIYEENDAGYYQEGLELFLGLGQIEMLGFTWEEIEAAYFAKNEINHARQAEGY